MTTIIIATITFIAGVFVGFVAMLARFIWLTLWEEEFGPMLVEAHQRFQKDHQEEFEPKMPVMPKPLPFIMATRNGLPVMLQGTWKELEETLARHSILGVWEAGVFRWTSIDGASWEIQVD